MTPPVKAWLRDDCRRLSIDIEKIQYQDLKSKRKASLRLQVIPKRASILNFHRRDSSDHSGTSTLAGDSKIGRPTFDNEYTDTDMLEILRDISLFICTRGMDRAHGDNENPSAELPPGASSWVSAGKNLITPASAQNYQRLNYARAVRAKFPAANNTVALLNGLDERVHRWSVDTTGQWLNSNGFEDSIQSFKDNDITGDILLDLTHDTLKDMGMHSTGRRIRLLKMIAELRLHVADLALQDAVEGAGGPDTPESLVDEPAFDRLAIN
ncbi:Adaptor for signal transduction [Podila epicladia]|nr:Adaptor for signal transduction [Podila epicladia]